MTKPATKRSTFKTGDAVRQRMTGRCAEVRRVFGSDIYIFYWIGERAPVFEWTKKRNWKLVEPA